LDGPIAKAAFSCELRLHPGGISSQLGFVGARDKIAKFFVLSGYYGLGRYVDRVEMIDETLSPVRVELEPLVEIFLFEDNAVVDTRHFARRSRFAGADRVVICFFAAR